MKQKPIVFSTPMVRAILDGTKTQTRRIIKPQPQLVKTEVIDGKPVAVMIDDGTQSPRRPYAAGDTLWVREKWRISAAGCCGGEDFVVFEYADGETRTVDVTPEKALYFSGKARWRPSIYMPREAARLFLEVANIRAERLRDITEEDAKAEGVKIPAVCGSRPELKNPVCAENKLSCYVHAFVITWDELNARRGCGWDANPWVWVIEFKRVEGGAR